MAEKEVTTEKEEKKPLAQPAQDEEKSSGGSDYSYWCDDHTEIVAGLDHIVALADVMASVIGNAMDACRKKGGPLEIDLNYNTLPDIAGVIEEKARRIKYLMEEKL